MKYFDEYDEYIEKLLLVQFGASEIIKHNLTKGEVREDFLKKEVKEQFENICYHKGFIVNNEREYQSGQLDMIITGNNARIRKYGDQSMVDIHDARIILEVKSCTTTSDLKKLDQLAMDIKSYSDTPQSIRVGMFCYSYAIQESNMLKKFGFRYDKEIDGYIDDKSIDKDFEHIDFVLALDGKKEDEQESKDFFLIKDMYSNRFVLKKKEPVSKDFFMLFSTL
ncbi:MULTISPECIES: hypothetical protein [unclassified Paenibacillus]|uniref:hypothetical protein n=1 Tax=unclassified Paenibacillus TaxID=185978 RepID=UPI0004269D51|nr:MULTISPECIES: hypothetical protein [unclassified Paenibacillus]KGP78545.1 hypothetical protein P364_0127875 [Paenibacillus sp. MAEPY2]KGP86512.1 hypothetical protein P363_0116850 [Paenibacillus sp. MAEPY1]